MKKGSSVGILIGLLFLNACGSASTSDGQAPPPAESARNESPSPAPSSAVTPEAGATVEAPDAGAAESGGDAAPAEAASAVPVTPMLDVMQTVPTGIKVGWYNTPDCDSIVGEMKNGLQSYQVVFTVAGSETSTIDITSASFPNHSSVQFTYRVRCKKGTTFSAYSNELSTFGPP